MYKVLLNQERYYFEDYSLNKASQSTYGWQDAV